MALPAGTGEAVKAFVGGRRMLSAVKGDQRAQNGDPSCCNSTHAQIAALILILQCNIEIMLGYKLIERNFMQGFGKTLRLSGNHTRRLHTTRKGKCIERDDRHTHDIAHQSRIVTPSSE